MLVYNQNYKIFVSFFIMVSFAISSDVLLGYGNFDLSYTVGSDLDNNKNSCNNYGIRLGRGQCGCYYQSGVKSTCMRNKSSKYFQDAYGNTAIEGEILNCHEYYKNEKFLEYVRTLPHYNQHILDIKKRIEKGEQFKVKGFKQRFFLWWKKNKFHDFISRECKKIKEAQEEADRIKNERVRKLQALPRLNVGSAQEIYNLTKYCENLHKTDHAARHGAMASRLDARLKAVEKAREQKGACSDYSSQVKQYTFNDPDANVFNNYYGTELDKQLHIELCQDRVDMTDLQKEYADNIHVRAFTPIVYQVTAQAKIEKDVVKAFSLSDFSHDIVRIVRAGVHGVAEGVKTTLSLQHWKDTGLSLLRLAVILADEFARQVSLSEAFYKSIFLGDPDIFLEKNGEYENYCKEISEAIKQELWKTFEKIKKMSWEELAHSGCKHGTTFILDLVAMHYGSLIVNKAGREFVNQVANVMNSSVAEELVLETAGFGKIAVDEGADAVNMALDFMEETPELLSQGKSATEIARDLIKDIKTGRGSNFANQTKEQLLKSKTSCSELIADHEQKLADYIIDPDRWDNLGSLKNVSQEIRLKRIQGRINELQKQLRRQRYDLEIINELLKLRGC